MKKFLKILIGLVVLLVIAVAVFIYTFDANNYKPQIAELAESLVGRPVDIAGDVDISVYPWFGIKVTDLSIGNPDGFSKQALGKIGQFDIRIKLLPLMNRHLDVDKLVLDKLVVEFERNAAGQNNWTGLLGSSDNRDMEAAYGLNGLTVGGIEFTNSSFAWHDAVTGKQFNVSALNLSTQAVVDGQPLPVTVSAYVESNQPEWQATVNVNATLDFSGDYFGFDARNMKLVVKALLPGTKIEKISFAMIADSEVDISRETAKLSNTRMSIFGLVMSGNFNVENIFSVPVIEGPLKVKSFEAQALAEQLGSSIPEMKNPNSLKNIELTARLSTDFNGLSLDEVSAIVDNSQVTGFLNINDLTNPVVRYEINVDKIKWDDYRVVEEEADAKEIPLPLDLIRSTDLEGTLNIADVDIDNIKVSQFQVSSVIKDSLLKAIPVSMKIGESEVKATAQLDARTSPKFILAIKVNNVDADASINPFLRTIIGDDAPRMEGILNADASVKASGESVMALKRSAQGTIKLKMGEISLQGIDLEHTSRAVVADYANKNNFKTRASFVTENNPEQKTKFRSLSATLTIKDGKLYNNNLLLESDQANITGSGSLDFINSKLNYRPVIDMHVKNTVDIRDKLRDHPIEYQAMGDFRQLGVVFDSKKYELLVGRLLVQEAKERQIKKRLNNSKDSWGNVLSK